MGAGVSFVVASDKVRTHTLLLKTILGFKKDRLEKTKMSPDATQLFTQAVTAFTHKCRCHCSRYVLPCFSDKSQYITIGRALPPTVTFQ